MARRIVEIVYHLSDNPFTQRTNRRYGTVHNYRDGIIPNGASNTGEYRNLNI